MLNCNACGHAAHDVDACSFVGPVRRFFASGHRCACKGARNAALANLIELPPTGRSVGPERGAQIVAAVANDVNVGIMIEQGPDVWLSIVLSPQQARLHAQGVIEAAAAAEAAMPRFR